MCRGIFHVLVFPTDMFDASFLAEIVSNYSII